jgi:hypothetical protein
MVIEKGTMNTEIEKPEIVIFQSALEKKGMYK